MADKSDQLKALLEAKQYAQALTLIKSADDYNEGESFVFAVLRHKKASQALLNTALKTFIRTRQNWYRQHGYWVHSLSHFTGDLWEMGQLDWIKKLNKIAFDGVLELGDDNCSERLVGDFFRHSTWDMDPRDFHITTELLDHFKYGRAYGQARLAVSPFESEAAFNEWEARWHLSAEGYEKSFNYEAQESMVHTQGLTKWIKILADLGRDVSEFDGLIKRLLEAQLIEFKEKLENADKDWVREHAEKAITITKAQLAELDS